MPSIEVSALTFCHMCRVCLIIKEKSRDIDNFPEIFTPNHLFWVCGGFKKSEWIEFFDVTNKALLEITVATIIHIFVSCHHLAT